MSDQLSKDKEKSIVEAARKRFAHYGFSKVTMEEIATDVEMGKASLYYYFPNKENLFQAVIGEEQKEFVDEIEQILQEDINASKKLHEYVAKRLTYFQELLNLGTLSVRSFFDIKSVFKQSFLDFEKQELILLERIISEGIKSKEFSPSLSKETASVLLHILQGLRLRTLRMLKTQSLSKKDFNELQKEMILSVDIFIRGMKC